MTKKELVLAIPYFDGIQWNRNVGEPFNTEKLDEQLVEKMTQKGYLVTAKEYQARRNPEAAQAQAQADATADQLQSIYALLPGVTTLDGAVTAIQDLQGRVPSGEDQENVARARVFVQELRGLYPDAKDTEGLLQAARDTQARVATLEKLHAAPAGTDLPSNFTGRGKLAAFGLTTFESLRGKTAQQLDAIEGVTTDQAGKIVEAVEKHFSTQAE